MITVSGMTSPAFLLPRREAFGSSFPADDAPGNSFLGALRTVSPFPAFLFFFFFSGLQPCSDLFSCLCAPVLMHLQQDIWIALSSGGGAGPQGRGSGRARDTCSNRTHYFFFARPPVDCAKGCLDHARSYEHPPIKRDQPSSRASSRDLPSRADALSIRVQKHIDRVRSLRKDWSRLKHAGSGGAAGTVDPRTSLTYLALVNKKRKKPGKTQKITAGLRECWCRRLSFSQGSADVHGL